MSEETFEAQSIPMDDSSPQSDQLPGSDSRDDDGQYSDVVDPNADDSATQSDEDAARDEMTEEDPEAQVPWHKDPRWIDWQTEKEALRRQVAELTPLKNGVRAEGEWAREDGNPDSYREAVENQSEAQIRAYIEANVAHKVRTGQLPREQFGQQVQLETARQQNYQRELRNTIHELKGRFTHMDESVARTFGSSPQALAAIAEHTHNRLTAALEAQATALKQQHALELQRAKLVYGKAKAADRAQVTPEGNGGGLPPRPGAMPNPSKSPKEFERWYDAQLQNTKQLLRK